MHFSSLLRTAAAIAARVLGAALGAHPPALELYRSPAILSAWRVAE